MVLEPGLEQVSLDHAAYEGEYLAYKLAWSNPWCSLAFEKLRDAKLDSLNLLADALWTLEVID